jgi:chromosome segregation ATPase
MSFLLALQQHVRSPFRAVDEYDVHMDLRMREVVARLIVDCVGRFGGVQYVVITPSGFSFGEGVNVIVVQNVEGKSIVRIAK